MRFFDLLDRPMVLLIPTTIGRIFPPCIKSYIIVMWAKLPHFHNGITDLTGRRLQFNPYCLIHVTTGAHPPLNLIVFPYIKHCTSLAGYIWFIPAHTHRWFSPLFSSNFQHHSRLHRFRKIPEFGLFEVFAQLSKVCNCFFYILRQRRATFVIHLVDIYLVSIYYAQQILWFLQSFIDVGFKILVFTSRELNTVDIFLTVALGHIKTGIPSGCLRVTATIITKIHWGFHTNRENIKPFIRTGRHLLAQLLELLYEIFLTSFDTQLEGFALHQLLVNFFGGLLIDLLDRNGRSLRIHFHLRRKQPNRHRQSKNHQQLATKLPHHLHGNPSSSHLVSSHIQCISILYAQHT